MILIRPKGMREAVVKKLAENLEFQRVLASFDLPYDYKGQETPGEGNPRGIQTNQEFPYENWGEEEKLNFFGGKEILGLILGEQNV